MNSIISFQLYFSNFRDFDKYFNSIQYRNTEIPEYSKLAGGSGQSVESKTARPMGS